MLFFTLLELLLSCLNSSCFWLFSFCFELLLLNSVKFSLSLFLLDFFLHQSLFGSHLLNFFLSFYFNTLLNQLTFKHILDITLLLLFYFLNRTPFLFVERGCRISTAQVPCRTRVWSSSDSSQLGSCSIETGCTRLRLRVLESTLRADETKLPAWEERLLLLTHDFLSSLNSGYTITFNLTWQTS